jgi:sulfatase maturation enzyme AslB (radical SAM superfamily)
VLTNFAGEYIVLERLHLEQLVRHTLAPSTDIYNDLIARQFILDDESSVGLDLLATQYRTRHSRLADLTGLFIFVTTLRCEHSCSYCQVSRKSEDRGSFDMSAGTAASAVDLMFESPSPRIKIEFQGGEPLLAFDRIRQVVELTKERNVTEGRDLAFVIATNLALVTEQHLDFCRAHGISISTSLDGPEDLHNRNRPRPGHDSYARTVDGIRKAREALDHDQVAALMTTTPASLSRVTEIIDEYVRQGFDSIFVTRSRTT